MLLAIMSYFSVQLGRNTWEITYKCCKLFSMMTCYVRNVQSNKILKEIKKEQRDSVETMDQLYLKDNPTEISGIALGIYLAQWLQKWC